MSSWVCLPLHLRRMLTDIDTRQRLGGIRGVQAGLHGADVNAIVQQDPLLVLQNPAMLEDGEAPCFLMHHHHARAYLHDHFSINSILLGVA